MVNSAVQQRPLSDIARRPEAFGELEADWTEIAIFGEHFRLDLAKAAHVDIANTQREAFAFVKIALAYGIRYLEKLISLTNQEATQCHLPSKVGPSR